jgi:tripartite-type tricarboxylate transporter receptor subunit TctC
LAKAKPDRLNYASQGIGTAAHLTAELFKSMAGVKIVHVPYKGSGPALTDLVAGHVDIMFGELAAAHSHIRSGLLRALAVSSEKRNPAMPDVPTASEALPGFVVTSWWAMVAPPGTPPAIANKAVGSGGRGAQAARRRGPPRRDEHGGDRQHASGARRVHAAGARTLGQRHPCVRRQGGIE